MYKVAIAHKEDFSFLVKAEGSEFIVDAKGKTISPPSALLVSLGSCLGVYIRKYAEGAKLDLANFKINVEGDLTGPSPFSFKSIKVMLDLKGAILDERRKDALMQFIRNCPVHNTLKGNPEIEIELSL